MKKNNLLLLLLILFVLIYLVLFIWYLITKTKVKTKVKTNVKTKVKTSESFVSIPQNKEDEGPPPPDIPQMLKQIQSILGKISSPELIAHITSVADKDPGELARLLATQQK